MVKTILTKCKKAHYDKEESFKIINICYDRGLISTAEKSVLKECILSLNAEVKKRFKMTIWLALLASGIIGLFCGIIFNIF